MLTEAFQLSASFLQSSVSHDPSADLVLIEPYLVLFETTFFLTMQKSLLSIECVAE